MEVNICVALYFSFKLLFGLTKRDKPARNKATRQRRQYIDFSYPEVQGSDGSGTTKWGKPGPPTLEP